MTNLFDVVVPHSPDGGTLGRTGGVRGGELTLPAQAPTEQRDVPTPASPPPPLGFTPPPGPDPFAPDPKAGDEQARDSGTPRGKKTEPEATVTCSVCRLQVPAARWNGQTVVGIHYTPSPDSRTGERPCPGSMRAPLGGAPIERQLVLTPASDITLRAVRWLWKDRIPAGMMSLIAGREGEGKSTNAYEIFARITTGRLPGEYEGKPRDVIVVATEDSWEHTVKPRLLAAKADLKRVFRASVKVTSLGAASETTLSLPDDLSALEAAIKQKDAAALLLDPVISRLSSKLDTHKDAEVRQALEPLVAVADRTGCAILGVIHVNKSATTDPLTAVMASRAFTAVTRAVLFVTRDGDQRLLCFPKSNLGPEQPSIAFKIAACTVGEEAETGRPVTASFVEWGAEVKTTAREALERAHHVERPIDRARAWLAARLTTSPEPSEKIKSEAHAAGHTLATLKRAATELGVKVGQEGKETRWSLLL